MTNNPKMLLNHLSLPTPLADIAREAKFFEDYFGAKHEFTDPTSGSALLRHGDIDIVLDSKKENVHIHKDFHFGFEYGTKREVDELYENFKRAGVKLDTEVFNHIGRGSRFFGRTPRGLQFEINTREDRAEKWDPKK